MNASTLLSPAALVVAAGALVFAFVQRGEVGGLERKLAEQELTLARLAAERAAPPAEAPAPSVAAPAAVDLSGVEARLVAVEREARSAGMLARTLAERPAAGGAAPAAAGDDDDDGLGGLVSLADEVAALRTDVDALLTGRGLETPEAKQAVRAAMAEAREQARAEREAKRAERRAAWFEQFATEHGLNADQKTRLQAAMDESQRVRNELREAMQSGEKTREEMREAMRNARQAFDASVDGILDAEQRAAFDAGQREQRGGRGGDWGGGGGRGGDWGGGGRGGRGE